MGDKFRIHKIDRVDVLSLRYPAPWAMDYPDGYTRNGEIGVACDTFKHAVAEFIEAHARMVRVTYLEDGTPVVSGGEAGDEVRVRVPVPKPEDTPWHPFFQLWHPQRPVS